MIYKKVFETALTEIREDCIVVKGRALDSIFKGDVVSFWGANNKSLFTVIDIETYRRKVSMLASVMTGELVLFGKEYDVPKNDNNLYIVDFCIIARREFLCDCIMRQFNCLPGEIKQYIEEINNAKAINNLIQFLYKYETIKELEKKLKSL